jgi:hypothetical protein
MVVLKKFESERSRKQARPDLGREYRPIGIGAVAAALTVTGEKKSDEDRSDAAGDSGERYRYWNSLAA